MLLVSFCCKVSYFMLEWLLHSKEHKLRYKMCHFLVLSMKSCTQRKLNNYISILMTCCSEDIKVDFLKLLFLLLWNDKNAVCTLNSVTNTCWHVILISLGLGPCTHLQISCTRVTTLKSTCSGIICWRRNLSIHVYYRGQIRGSWNLKV